MRCLIEIAVFDPDLQEHVTTVGEPESFFLTDQITGNKSEQVGRFFEWIFPFGEMSAFRKITLINEIAVGQENRIFFLVSEKGDRIACHDVRAVRIVCDFAESFSFALGKEIPVRNIQSHQGCVFIGANKGIYSQRDVVGRIRDSQFTVVQCVIRFFQRATVHDDFDKFQILTVQNDLATV